MMRWRLARNLLPLGWLVLTAAFLGVAAWTRRVPARSAPEGERAVMTAADRAAIEELVAILWSESTPAAGAALGGQIASWMARVERREGRERPAGSRSSESLYDLVDRHYENLSETDRPLAATPEGPGERWTRFLDDWRAWSRRHEVFDPLELALAELWLPGDARSSVEILADDGLGRVAARWPEILEPRETTAVSGWTIHQFDGIRRQRSFPPRRRGVSLWFRVTRPNAQPEVFRLPLAESEASPSGPEVHGCVKILAPDSGEVAGLALLWWSWPRSDRP